MGDEQRQGSIAPALLVIFLDENHCRNRHVIDAIEGSGIRCEKHLDHFAAGTDDVVWLPEVGERGWCLLTTDARIRSNLLEREAVRQNFVRMFYSARNNLSGKEMGATVPRAIPAMVSAQRPPFIASVSRGGDVRPRDTFELETSG